MLELIKKLLLKIIDDIDKGNSNITEQEGTEILQYLHNLSYRDTRYSKYKACQYLGVSRATFDNYVRNGRIPKGTHEAGFKELSWSKKDLDEALYKMVKS